MKKQKISIILIVSLFVILSSMASISAINWDNPLYFLKISGGLLSGNLNMSNHNITNIDWSFGKINSSDVQNIPTGWIDTSNLTYSSHVNNLTLHNETFHYNQTIPSNSYTDSVNVSITSWVNNIFLKIADMFTTNQILSMISGNRTEIETNTNNAINGNLTLAKTYADNSINGNISMVRGDINNNYSSALSYSNTNLNGNVTMLRTDIQNNYTSSKSYTDAQIVANESRFLSTYNITYDTTTNSYNGNISILLGTINNASYLSTSNDTYTATTSAYNGNITSLLGTLNNASYLRTDNSSYYLQSNPSNYQNSTYNLFNKTYADTLYSAITWNYNGTTPAIAYTDALNSSYYKFWNNQTASANTYTDTQVNKTFNQTLTGLLYLSNTGFDAGNITLGTLSILRFPSLTNTHTLDALNITTLSGFNNKITFDAANITSGTFAWTRLPSFTNALTLHWLNITNKPAACGAGQYASTVGDTLTCSAPSGSNDAHTHAGENISSGTIPFARLPTLTNMLTLDYLNITGTKPISATDLADWTQHNSFPAACSAGNYVTTIGDTNTCAVPSGTNDAHTHKLNNLTNGNLVVNLNMTSNNITQVNYIKFVKITGACDLTINGSICSNQSGTFLIG